jgi:predicted DNA-binding transcriptional regulator AlpA
MTAKVLNTSEAAKLVGIDRTSLQRWIATKRVKAPAPVIRNGRAVRLWSPADIEALKATKAKTYRKGRGRKPKGK